MAAAAPSHLASLPRDAADSMLAQKARVEAWRRKGAHLVGEGTREMGASLRACTEGKSPKQTGQGTITKKSTHSCSKATKLSGQTVTEYKVSCFAMAGERPLPFFTAPRNLEMPEKRPVPFPILQSLKPSVQSQPSRDTGTSLPAHRLRKGKHNLHYSRWQEGPQIIKAPNNCALALLGTGWQWEKIWESWGQQDLPMPLVTSACCEQGPLVCRGSRRLHAAPSAHFCAQGAGPISDAWAGVPGERKDGGRVGSDGAGRDDA